MSGIAGMYHRDGKPADVTMLTRMSAAQHHRGPDGTRLWTSGALGFIHGLLATTPESAHERHEALADPAGARGICWDGRIDNREELISRLAASGYPLPGHASDAAIARCAYDRWGKDCPAHIDGDFAFAVWDARERRLFCARDPIGMRPFFFAQVGDTFLFASEIQPLFAHPRLSRSFNDVGLASHILGEVYSREATLYRRVSRLAPGHTLTVEAAGVRTSRYWRPEATPLVRYRTDDEYADAFAHLFRDAVRARLRSSGPVAATLSGGLDSSSVVATAAALGGRTSGPVRAYSVTFDAVPCDERVYQDAVAALPGVESVRVRFEAEAAPTLSPTAALAHPDVIYGATLFMLAPALADMRRRRIRVMLDGIGGDDVLAPGLEHLTDLLRAGRVAALVDRLRADARECGTSPMSLLLTYCVGPHLPPSATTAARWARATVARAGGRPDDRSLVVTPRLRRRVRAASHAARRASPARGQAYSRQAICDDLAWGWNSNVVLDQVNLYFARAGVEARSPFFDRRVVEFALGVPPDQRRRGNETKYVLRRALRGSLPELVRRRQSKMEFSPAVDFLFRGQYARLVKDTLTNPALADLGVVDPRRVRRVVARYLDARGAYATSLVQTLLGLELWTRGQACTSAQ